jgi:hypothetical protein
MNGSTFFTDNGPSYQCSICGEDTSGEIGHQCGGDPGEEDGPWAEGWKERSKVK